MRGIVFETFSVAVVAALVLSGGSTASAAGPDEARSDAPAAVSAVSADELATTPARDVASVLPTSTIFGSAEAVGTTPGSGFYLDTEDIRQQTYDDINRILRKSPGVYLREEDGYGLFPNISLRGVDPGRSAKVTIMEDGILQAPAPYSAPSAYYSPTAGRMHAIEVLKGSSQVRFGPHITGGAINYISTPIPLTRQGYVKAIYGSDNEFRTHAWFGETINLESGGRIGYLVEGYFRTTEGFKDFDPLTPDFNGDDTGFTNIEPMVKFMWEPDTAVYQRVEFKYGYTDREFDGGYLGLSESDFDDDPFDRYPATRFDNIDTYQHRSYLKHYAELTDHFSIESAVYYNKFHRNWFKLHSVDGGDSLSEALAGADGGMDLAILKGQAAGEFNVRANNRDYESYGFQTVPRFDFAWGETQHSLEVGVRVHHDEIRRRQWSVDYMQNAMGAIVSSTRNPDGSAGNRLQETTALAIHVRDEIRYDRWTFVPGFRYEHLWQDYTDFESDPTDTVKEEGDGTLDLFGGGMGVTYDWSENLQLYGGAHYGFSPPGPRAAIRSGLEEETSLAFELGTRFDLPQHAFRGEVTGFYTMFDDLIAINNIGGVGSVDGTAENVGEIDSFGIEVYLEWDPGRAYQWGFNMPTFLSFTYTNAELASDTGGDPESIFSGGVEGNKVPYIPEYQLTIGTGIEVPDTFGIFITGNWVSETYATASNTSMQVRPDGTPDSRFGEIDSRFLVDLSGYYQLTESARIVAGVHNLLDEEYIASRLPHGPRPGRGIFGYVGVELRF